MLGGLSPNLLIGLGDIMSTQESNATKLQSTLNNPEKKKKIAWIFQVKYGATVRVNNVSLESGGTQKLKIKFTGGGLDGKSGTSTTDVHNETGKGDIQLNIDVKNKGRLEKDTSGDTYNKVAEDILEKLKKHSVTVIPSSLDADKLVSSLNDPDVKSELAQMINTMYGAEVEDPAGVGITVAQGSADQKLEVKFTEGVDDKAVRKSTGNVVSSGSKGVKLTIKIKDGKKGSLEAIESGSGENDPVAKAIYEKLKRAAEAAKTQKDKSEPANRDFNAFTFIAAHDMLAMFCRFFYGKLAVGYNWTRISLGYCLPKFRPRHKGFGFGFWWWFGRTFSRAWADTVKDFKADIKDYL